MSNIFLVMVLSMIRRARYFDSDIRRDPPRFVIHEPVWPDLGEVKKVSVFVMLVHPPVQDDPRRFLALVARFALAVMTLLVALAILVMALLVRSAVFAPGPAIKLPVLCWRY